MNQASKGFGSIQPAKQTAAPGRKTHTGAGLRDRPDFGDSSSVQQEAWMIRKASAVVACLALAVLTTYAQAPQAGRGGQRQGGPAAAQPANAKVIETMMDNLGMLRGMQRNDSVNRVEMWGENGTKVIGGKPVTLTNWKVSLNFTMNGMRFDYTHDGQRTIEVVRSEEHTSELQSLRHLVCRLLLEKKK